MKRFSYLLFIALLAGIGAPFAEQSRTQQTEEASAVASPLNGRVDAAATEWSQGTEKHRVAAVCTRCKTPEREDNSGYFSVAWNAENLFVIVEVADQEVDTDGGEKLFEHDSVELTIDCAEHTGGASAFSHVVFGANGDVSKKFAFTPGGVQVAATKTLQGYLIEAALDWQGLCKTPPTPGTRLAFNVVINDRDNEKRSSQSFWRYTSRHWQGRGTSGEVWLDTTLQR